MPKALLKGAGADTYTLSRTLKRHTLVFRFAVGRVGRVGHATSSHTYSPPLNATLSRLSPGLLRYGPYEPYEPYEPYGWGSFRKHS